MRSTSKAWYRLLATVVALTLAIPALTAFAAQDTGKVLRVHHEVYPDVVDPQKSSYVNEIDILVLVYEGLTRIDTDLQTIPAAAESWEYNEDATQLTFHLGDGLKYSDGSPLAAENFRYAVERTCDPNTAGEYQSILFGIVGCAEFAGLAVDSDGNPREFTDAEHEAARAALGVRVLDDRTLQIDLSEPAPYFHTIAGLWVFSPVRKEIVEANPDNWWQSPENHIGNGPFTVTGIDQDQRWTFAANDNYRLGRPKLDGIEYRYITDNAVALDAYRAGDLDIVVLAPSQIPEVDADPELAEQRLTYPTASTFGLEMNLNKEPFNDVMVRRAFSYATDRETLCTVVREGDCIPTLSWIPQGIPGAIETDRYGFDPEAARQALAESSYGGPENLPTVEIYYNPERPQANERAEWLAGQYRDILDVDIELKPTDPTTLISLSKDNSTEPMLQTFGGWIQDYPDPQNWLSVYWTCDSTFAQVRGYCNEEFDRLTHLGDTTVDPEERIKYYQQAGEILVEDQPGPFVFNLAANFVVKPSVTGYTPTAMETDWPGQYSSLMTIDMTG
jgi:oligopeptide transport system substrate-binding protein